MLINRKRKFCSSVLRTRALTIMDMTPTSAPKPKRLGLSRSVGRNPVVTSKKTPDSTNTILKSSDDAATKPTRPTPNSVNYEKLSLKSNLNETPVSSKPNKATYKLSLCKSTAEAITRKRLHSQQSKSLIQPKRLRLEVIQAEESSSQIKACDTEPPSDENGKTSTESEPPLDSLSLQKEIDEIKKKIATNEKYDQRSSELQGLITKWQEAGVKTIDELKEKIKPTQDVAVILAHFHINPGLFDL